MKVLGIDSSGTVASVAIIEDGKMTACLQSDTSYTHSTTLLPMIDKAFSMADTDKKSIDLVAVAKGPGSFTGLRIGAGSAKGFACALGIPIAPVSTLDALGYLFPFADGIVCPIMNARRSQVYTACYKNGECISQEEAISLDELFEKLYQYEEKVIFLGDGVPEYKDYIKENFKAEYVIAPPHLLKQSAGAVACLGERMKESGKAVEIRDFKLTYLRKSQAERERDERNKL